MYCVWFLFAIVSMYKHWGHTKSAWWSQGIYTYFFYNLCVCSWSLYHNSQATESQINPGVMTVTRHVRKWVWIYQCFHLHIKLQDMSSYTLYTPKHVLTKHKPVIYLQFLFCFFECGNVKKLNPLTSVYHASFVYLNFRQKGNGSGLYQIKNDQICSKSWHVGLERKWKTRCICHSSRIYGDKTRCEESAPV